jgi:hypothetical protein
MTEEKIKEIRKMLRHGVPEGEIRETLKNEGYPKNEIDTIFKPHHYDMRSWYLFFGIVVCLAGLYLFLTNGTLLIFMLGILLFVAYFYEIKRLNDLKKLK